VKNSQYEDAVFERFEDIQVISVGANPHRISQIRARDIVMRSVGDFLAVLPYLADERDSAQRIVERDVIADLLQVNFGLGCEMRSHSLRAVFGAYSDDGDRRFRFIVTGLERGEVLKVNDNSVGHDGLWVGTGFGCLSGTA
jgi:hypothetical protein